MTPSETKSFFSNARDPGLLLDRSLEDVCASWDAVKEAVPNYKQEVGVILLQRVLAIAPHKMSALISKACKNKSNNKETKINSSSRTIAGSSRSIASSNCSMHSDEETGYSAKNGTIRTDSPAFLEFAKRLVRIIDLMIHLMSIDLEVATLELIEFGATFAKGGIQPHHYAIFGEAFVATLTHILEEEDEYGECVSARTKSSWNKVFKFVSSTLIKGAKKAGVEHPRPPSKPTEEMHTTARTVRMSDFVEPIKTAQPSLKSPSTRRHRVRSHPASSPLPYMDDASTSDISETKSLPFFGPDTDDQSMTSRSTTSTLEQKRRRAYEKRQAALNRLAIIKQQNALAAQPPKGRVARIFNRKSKAQILLVSPTGLKQTTLLIESAQQARSERRLEVERSTNHYLTRLE